VLGGMAITILAPMTGAAQAVSLTIFNSQTAYDAAVSADASLARTNVTIPADGVSFIQPSDIFFASSPTGAALEGRVTFNNTLTNLDFSRVNPATDDLIITPGGNVRAIGFDYLVGLPGTDPLDSFTSKVFFDGESNPRAEKTNVGGSSILSDREFFFGVISDMPLATLLLTSTGGGVKSPFQYEFIRNISYATVSNISVVPLPAALPLYGSGLAILGFIGWRKKRKLA